MLNLKPTLEDIQLWESERQAFLNNPIEYKTQLITNLTLEAEIMAAASCGSCIFSQQCDGYQDVSRCQNPSATFINVAAEVKNYLGFLLDRQWETSFKE